MIAPAIYPFFTFLIEELRSKPKKLLPMRGQTNGMAILKRNFFDTHALLLFLSHFFCFFYAPTCFFTRKAKMECCPTRLGCPTKRRQLYH